MANLPPLPAAPDVNNDSDTPGPTKAEFDELKGLVLGLAASVKTLATSVESLNTTVEAMRIQMAAKEVEATRIQMETKEQVDDLITTVDTLAYNTKACCCNEKRTDKGTALLL